MTLPPIPLQDEFVRFGTLRSVWVARKPPGFGACSVLQLLLTPSQQLKGLRCG